MNRDGHVGLALASYAPIGFVVARSGAHEIAFLGAGLAVALATLPDVDTRIPLVSHRGFTHTAWFAALVGVGCWVVAARVAPASVSAPIDVPRFSFAVGATSIGSHVAGDWLTPAGVRPFAPFGTRRSVGLVRGSNRIANWLLLVLGLGVLVAALWLATGTA